MWNLSKIVTDACVNIGVPFTLISIQESKSLIQKVVSIYTTCNKYEYPMWDNLIGSESFHDPLGWKLFDKYVGQKQVYLFFEPSDCKEVIKFENMIDIIKILSDTPGFVFYITDDMHTYLMCFNDHDVLLASGGAASWVRQLRAGGATSTRTPE